MLLLLEYTLASKRLLPGLLLVLTLQSNVGLADDVEFTIASNYRKYEIEKDDNDNTPPPEMGAGMRLRYTNVSKEGWGWFARVHFDEHILAPALIPGLVKRWGSQSFFEIGVGPYIGYAIDGGLSLAVMPAVGIDLGKKFFLVLPVFWNLNYGIWVAEVAPFFGYRF